jgi:exopolysaccharide production protein ExoQ
METIRHHDSAGRLEKVFTFCVLFLSTGAFLNLTATGSAEQDLGTGQAGMQILWFVLYLIAIVLLFRKCSDLLKTVLREYLLVGLVILAVVSTSWSADPSVSFRRSVALILTCMFGVYFGLRFDLREQLRLMGYVAGSCVVFSLLFGIFGLGTPSVDLAPAWYGVFSHKNELGKMMVLSIVVFLVLLKRESGQRALLRCACGLSFLLLLLSRSTTSVVGIAAILAFFPFCSMLSRNIGRVIKVVLAMCASVALGCYWAGDYLWRIPELFGKDITLTGRLQLWILCIAMALRQPWLGYGYNAFWLGPGSPSERLWAVMPWDAPQAHNGLLEVWLELGLLGVIIFVAGFTLYLVRAIGFLRDSKAVEAAWPLLFLALMVMNNLTETTILSRNNIFWILYTAVAVTISRAHALDDEPIPKTMPEAHLVGHRVANTA